MPVRGRPYGETPPERGTPATNGNPARSLAFEIVAVATTRLLCGIVRRRTIRLPPVPEGPFAVEGSAVDRRRRDRSPANERRWTAAGAIVRRRTIRAQAVSTRDGSRADERGRSRCAGRPSPVARRRSPVAGRRSREIVRRLTGQRSVAAAANRSPANDSTSPTSAPANEGARPNVHAFAERARALVAPATFAVEPTRQRSGFIRPAGNDPGNPAPGPRQPGPRQPGPRQPSPPAPGPRPHGARVAARLRCCGNEREPRGTTVFRGLCWGATAGEGAPDGAATRLAGRDRRRPERWPSSAALRGQPTTLRVSASRSARIFSRTRRSFPKARARWEMRFFSSCASSAIVFSVPSTRKRGS